MNHTLNGNEKQRKVLMFTCYEDEGTTKMTASCNLYVFSDPF